MKLSHDGLLWLCTLEDFRAEPYCDVAGFQTIGFGHRITKEDNFSVPITREVATLLLANDVNQAETCICNWVHVPLNQNQFDALVSFVYNVGTHHFATSTLRYKLNEGDYEAVPKQMRFWVNAGGHFIEGLLHRREAEIRRWNTPITPERM